MRVAPVNKAKVGYTKPTRWFKPKGYEGPKRNRPWSTKAWKKMRDERIGDSCEQCGIGSEERRMVLQHLRHVPGASWTTEEYMSGDKLTQTWCDVCAYLCDIKKMDYCKNHGRYFKRGKRGCVRCTNLKHVS